jgi:uncharacterized protein (TIGR02231 family)
MSRIVPLLLSATTLAVLLPGASRAALSMETDDAKSISSQITEVTVYADRARVTRSASIDLADRTEIIAFRKLPGWIDEGSVRLALSPADAGQILDVEVERNHLAVADEEAVRKAEASVRSITDQITALDDEKAILDAQTRQIDAIRAFSAEKLPKDVASRDVKVSEFGSVVDYVADALRKNAAARRELEHKRRDLVPEQAARTKALGELQQRDQLEQRTVRVTLKGVAGKKAQLKLTYMLPGATWEPTQELRASDASSAVALSSYASVTQTTGEDWTGATLTFATQRPDETMKLPELESLVLGETSSGSRRVVSSAGDSFHVAMQVYGQENQVLANMKADYAGYYAQQQEVQTRVEAVFRELQERGTTAHFLAMTSPNIRTDGKPVRVPIGTANLAATHRILAAPEVSLNAARTVDLVNTSDQPLLPGKVALYLDGSFLGTTEQDFVASGEKFTMFTGVADRIKLARVLDKKHSSLERGGKKTKIQVSYLVTAENLAAAPASVQMVDRIPISENDDIKVSNVKISEGKPDPKGLLHWDLALAGKQSRQFRVEYTLEYPTERLAQYRVNKAAKMMNRRPSPARERSIETPEMDESMSNAPQPAPAAAEPSKKIMFEDIDSLEDTLK